MLTLRHRTQILLITAALGAAGMFFGPDGWFGLDIGPIGATALYAVFWMFAIHLARHPEAVFRPDASPAERQAWVGLVFVSFIAIHFARFLYALPALGARADQLFNSASLRFGINLAALLIAWGVYAGIAGWTRGGGVGLDERDLRIQHSAQRRANDVLCVLIVACVVVLALYPEALRSWLRPLLVANALVGLLIASSLAEHIWRVVRYRRARA